MSDLKNHISESYDVPKNDLSVPIVAFVRANGSKAFSCRRCAAMLDGGSYCYHCGQALEWQYVDGYKVTR